MSSRKRVATPSRAAGRAGNKRKEETDPVQVCCRLRPLGHGDRDNPSVVPVNWRCVKLVAPPGYTSRNGQAVEDSYYKFNKVFDGCANQLQVFDQSAFDLVKDLVTGKDGLLFTYGVTGSGKTFTMTGKPKNHQDGILPRSLDIIFNSLVSRAEKYTFCPDGQNGFELRSESAVMLERARMNLGSRTPGRKLEFKQRTPDTRVIAKINDDCLYAVFVSYVEVYNNFVYDLLEQLPPAERGEKPKPPTSKKLREDTKNNVVYVDNVVEVEVCSTEEAFEQFLRGQERRSVANTLLNTESSRSHSVFTIRLIMAPLDDRGMEPVRDKSQIHISQLCLVDLAGSERSKRTENVGERLAESGKINQSLMALCHCIEKLRWNQRSATVDRMQTIPYRDSKLTHLFKNYFDGGGKVRMIVCINPHTADYEENVFVMNFAELTQELEVNRAMEPNVDGDMMVGRRRFAQWDRDLHSILNKEDRAVATGLSTFYHSAPLFELNSACDKQSISQIIKHLKTVSDKQVECLLGAEQKLKVFEPVFRQHLCVADNHLNRISELEHEKNELDYENIQINSALRHQDTRFRGEKRPRN